MRCGDVNDALGRSPRAIGPETQWPAMTRFPNTTPGQSGGNDLTVLPSTARMRTTSATRSPTASTFGSPRSRTLGPLRRVRFAQVDDSGAKGAVEPHRWTAKFSDRTHGWTVVAVEELLLGEPILEPDLPEDHPITGRSYVPRCLAHEERVV